MVKNLYRAILLIFIVTISSANYDKLLARDLLYYATAAYELKSSSNWSCAVCKHISILDPADLKCQQKHLFGFTGYSPSLKAIIVSARGTIQTMQNYLVDLDYFSIPYKSQAGATVHRGFFTSMQSLREQLLENVAALAKKYPNQKIYVTGHSLGGALAVLLAAQLSQTYKLNQVYTFGSPRIGNKKFAEFIDRSFKVYRVVNNRDIIPGAPPKDSPFQVAANNAKNLGNAIQTGISNGLSAVKNLFGMRNLRHQLAVPKHDSYIWFSFWHEGVEVWYEVDKRTIHSCQSEDVKCFNSVPLWRQNIPDHMPDAYIKTLVRAISEKWVEK